MSHGLDRRCRLGGKTDAYPSSCADRDDRVSISAGHDLAEVLVNGWLLWGLFLPILLVVAGVITLRRRNGRR
jgi:hypothetical protein